MLNPDLPSSITLSNAELLDLPKKSKWYNTKSFALALSYLKLYPDTNSRVLKLKKAIFKAYLDQTKDFRTSIFGGK